MLVFLHGFSDHINAYYDLFPTLAGPPYNIAVHGIDQRGWGRSVHSPAERGLTGPTQTVIHDVHTYLLHVCAKYTSTPPGPSMQQTAETQARSPPLFIMGHSKGGATALYYFLSVAGPDSPYSLPLPIRGVLAEAPLITLDPSTQPNAFSLFIYRQLAKLLPRTQMKPALDASKMSRSPKVCEEWANDPLCHDTGTLGGMSAMLDRSAELNSIGTDPAGATKRGLTRELAFPLWIGHGTADKVNAFAASKRLADAIIVTGLQSGHGAVGPIEDRGDKTFRAYEGAYHQLHAEPGGLAETFAKEVGEWIVARAGRTPPSSRSRIDGAEPMPGSQHATADEPRAKL